MKGMVQCVVVRLAVTAALMATVEEAGLNLGVDPSTTSGVRRGWEESAPLRYWASRRWQSSKLPTPAAVMETVGDQFAWSGW